MVEHDPKPPPPRRTITVGGQPVNLDGPVYVDLQNMVDECLDRHAIALLREHTHCSYEEARAALVNESNFSHEARKHFIANRDAAPAAKPRSKPKREKKAKAKGQGAPSAGGLFSSLVSGGGGSGKDKAVKLVMAALMLGLSFALYALLTGQALAPDKPEFYYDLKTNELYLAAYSRASPVAAPSDGDSPSRSGVRAYVFSCRSCESSSDRFAGYLIKNSDAMNQAIAAQGESFIASSLSQEARTRMLRTPEGDEWVLETAPEAAAVYAYPSKVCDGGQVKRCYPTSTGE